jgi:hypothetical protein
MTNAGNSDQRLLFENLAQDLSPEHQAEFYRTLHEIGIGPEDRDLAKLFRALQIYKSFYEEIPLGCAKRSNMQTSEINAAVPQARPS